MIPTSDEGAEIIAQRTVKTRGARGLRGAGAARARPSSCATWTACIPPGPPTAPAASPIGRRVLAGTIERGVAETITAAEHARAEAGGLNGRRRREGLPVTDFSLGLHPGEVFYGNAGSLDRLDFTVVGAAVNEVARTEAMCRALEQEVILSADFAGAARASPRSCSPWRAARTREGHERKHGPMLVTQAHHAPTTGSRVSRSSRTGPASPATGGPYLA